jgi:1-deoxy-D-xylulose-5-phosphate reductoisomerase
MSPPDMRVPIAYALGSPQRPEWGAETVDWTTMSDLTFEPVDTDTFRMLPLAYRAGRTSGTAPAVFNAANEVAVEAFLEGELAFLRVDDLVERVLDEGEHADIGFGTFELGLADVLSADAWARDRAKTLISE